MMTETTTAGLQDLNFFDDPNLDRTVGLVFELASQLHVERQRRMALETLLLDKNIIKKNDMDTMTVNTDFMAISNQNLDQSLRQLMRVITEKGDETGPLRAEMLDME